MSIPALSFGILAFFFYAFLYPFFFTGFYQFPLSFPATTIPLIARMICVADAFDAMNSNRVYRNKLTKEDIINEIEKNKGKQFDPDIADTFLRLIKDRNFDYDLR